MREINGNCILCGGALEKPIFENVTDRLGISQRPWTFYRCGECGSAILHPIPPQEELLAAYPAYYSFAQAPRDRFLPRLLHSLEEKLFYRILYARSVQQVLRITGLRNGRLLDVGGGTGHRTAFFQQVGWTCAVLDPDERALRVARQRFGLQTYHGLLETLDLPPESFDVITFYAVIEHLPDPHHTLRAAYRLLRPGGWIVAMVPILYGWQLFLGIYWHQVREAPRHVALPTPEGMHHLFNACGFELHTWEAGDLIDEAGIFALSILPASASAIACASPGLRRLVYRIAGGVLTGLAIPLAVAGRMIAGPSIGVFFARRPKELAPPIAPNT